MNLARDNHNDNNRHRLIIGVASVAYGRLTLVIDALNFWINYSWLPCPSEHHPRSLPQPPVCFSTSRRTVALLINPIVYLPSPLKKLAAKKFKPMYIDIDTFTQYLYQLFKIQLPLPKICSSCVDNGSGMCYSQPGRPPKTTQNFESLKLGNVCPLVETRHPNSVKCTRWLVPERRNP